MRPSRQGSAQAWARHADATAGNPPLERTGRRKLVVAPAAPSRRVRRLVPATDVPQGYGRYCSVSYPTGGWAFATLSQGDSDPCGALLASSPGGTIERAGLWDTRGMNNVLWNCRQGLGIYAAQGSAATAFAYDDATSKKKTHCVFVVAPQRLPVFGLPWGKTDSGQSDPNADVGMPSVFNFNIYREDWDVTEFGQVQEPGWNRGVDRLGRGRSVRESAYDWSMPAGKPIVSVARGRVLAARDRDVTAFGCPSPQKEIYVQHRVGEGEYAEEFVTYYAHVSSFSVETGDIVQRGQELGKNGTTGCSSGDHLHFGVWRLTNLSGHRFHDFRLQDTGYGVNGLRGTIDPFGWAAPSHIDPWAWRYLNGNTYWDDFESTIAVANPGAFSINLWREGETPPFE
ncbi:M23 family metallopeptidase [Lysobacter sp. A3-1-A15]|uniref:M23 family metallopeptidase n=1 Tax=Novilysobacter viscosus TaxID=3098602 RepID=UPI002EDAE5BB